MGVEQRDEQRDELEALRHMTRGEAWEMYRAHCLPDYALPPGPRGVQAQFQHMLGFTADPMGSLERLRVEYGDVITYFLGARRNYQLTDPELIDAVLLRQHDDFVKDEMLHKLNRILGRGLLVSEGTHWRTHRKIAAPFLKKKQIASYADTMVALTHELLDGWQDGQVVDLFAETTRLTLRIVVRTLFGIEMPEERMEEVGEAMEATMTFFQKLLQTFWYFVPDFVPHPLRSRFDAAVLKLHEVIDEIIVERRALPEGDDLLWRLLHTTYEDGSPLSDEQLRDEALTMFLAGHETTTLAIGYAWHLLTRDDDALASLRAEVDERVADTPGQRLGFADAMSMPYTRAVVQESLRLYPPAWAIGREALRDTELGGWHIPKGAQIFIPQFLLHRDARWFDEPEAFRPERWLDGLERSLPRGVYAPFGGGPRVCIGNHFAMMEAMLIVATMAQRVTMEDVSGEPLRLAPSITARPTGVRSMRVTLRTAPAPVALNAAS